METIYGGVGIIIGSVLTGLTALIIALMRERAKLQKEARADANTEWQTVSLALQKRVDSLEERVERLHTEHTECEKRSAVQAAEILSLRGDRETMAGQLKSLQTDKDALQAEVKLLKSTNGEQQAQINALQAQVEIIKQDAKSKAA